MFFSTEESAASTSFAVFTRSIRVLPQVGHAIKSGPSRFPRQRKISFAAAISLIGSSVKDTRMVSPIPSCSKEPIPIADLMIPTWAVPASVTPK